MEISGSGTPLDGPADNERAGSSAPDADRAALTEGPVKKSLRAQRRAHRSDRPIRAVRAKPGAEQLRTAYLELLKLTLCDLAGARTLSVTVSEDTSWPDSRVRWRELPEEELSIRATGLDWPFSGLTMVGLKRLDELQACLEAVVAGGVEGDVIETGTWRGGASILARATLDSLGADERTVWLADSFRGLPTPDTERFPQDAHLDLSQVEFLAVPADEVRRHFSRFGLDHGVELVEGSFDETLPELRDRRWSVVRLDGDTYEATWIALDHLYPGLSEGGYLIVDDYGLIEPCRQAVDDYRREHDIDEPVEWIDWMGIHWRRRDEPRPGTPRATPAHVSRTGGSRAENGGSRTRIPSERELALEVEVRRLRALLALTEGMPE